MSEEANEQNEFKITFDSFLDDKVEFHLTKEEIKTMINGFINAIK